MTVMKISTSERYIGESTDTKPTMSTDKFLSAGWEFLELDTGQNFIFDGVNWREDIRLIKALTDVLS